MDTQTNKGYEARDDHVYEWYYVCSISLSILENHLGLSWWKIIALKDFVSKHLIFLLSIVPFGYGMQVYDF